MARDLTSDERAFFESLLAKADPYPEDVPIWNVLDGEQDSDRAMATIAKMALEGRLR